MPQCTRVGILAALLVAAIACPSALAETPLKVLIVDGQNNHDWVACTPILLEILNDPGLFAVEVATSPAEGKPMDDFKPAFKDYDVIVMNYTGDSWCADANTALEAYVKGGGGLVIVHAANNAFPGWAEYNKMIGLGGWGGRTEKDGPYVYLDEKGKVVRDMTPGSGGTHGARWRYPVETRKARHPIMRKLPKVWRHTKDELYATLRGPAENMTILATAYSKKTKRDEPALFTIDYGEGKVFHTILGHDVESMNCVGFATTLIRGTEWAATGKVTYPVPDNFPGKSSISVWKK
jgi:uncharacterized protein